MDSTQPPRWAHCGDGASASDPVGCRGVTVSGSARCLSHAPAAEQHAYLTSLSPGDNLDLRGTTITTELLHQILAQVTGPGTTLPRLGSALFTSATFVGDADFRSARFDTIALFDSVTFTAAARFDSVTFTNYAWFDSATFTGAALFRSATFTSTAWFDSATFSSAVRLQSATFAKDATFSSALFERATSLGPLICKGILNLSGACFGAPVTVEAAAWELLCRRTRWEQTATLWLRYAEADLSDAVFERPLAVAGRQSPFTVGAGRAELDENILEPMQEQARVKSLRGVDAAQLVLTDLDLSGCLFSGTIHLDQLRLEGRCLFHTTPRGVHWRRWLPVRYTRRRALAEEQHWRHIKPGAVPGWLAPPPGANKVKPAALAAVYRALRKSYEDSRNEPGAADFYFGEMEMRRADTHTDPAERGLLTAYWVLSGYGLRATRSLGWLLSAATLSVLASRFHGVGVSEG